MKVNQKSQQCSTHHIDSAQHGGLRTKGVIKKQTKEHPLVSIITAVFNGESHLQETLETIRNQEYPNLEIIVIDGGSTDGTLDIIKQYEHVMDYWISEPDQGISDAFNKGFEELTQALNWIDKDKVECIVFGSSEPECAPNVGIKIHYLGRLNDELSLTSVYNAADVMVVPSLQESFGQTASESLSCGTPVVAFAHSGLLDIVDHKHNGYLAEPFSAKDLAKGIDWVLTNQKYSELSENAREKAVNTFDFSIVSGVK